MRLLELGATPSLVALLPLFPEAEERGVVLGGVEVHPGIAEGGEGVALGEGVEAPCCSIVARQEPLGPAGEDGGASSAESASSAR